MAARWLVAATLVIALSAAYGVTREPRGESAIWPDVDVAAQVAAQPMAGRWKVASWSNTTRGAEGVLERGVTIEVRHGAVRLTSPGHDHVYAATSIESRPEGERWNLSSPSAGRVSVLVRRSGTSAPAPETVTVTVQEGRWTGTATLERLE